MKNFILPGKTVIQIVVAVTVVGALINHDYKLAGLIVSLIAVGFYLALNLRMIVSYLIHFRRIDRISRIRLCTGVGILYIFISALITDSVYYFLLLLMLGIDYLIFDKKEKR